MDEVENRMDETMMYSIVKKCATQINLMGELKILIQQGKNPIVVIDETSELRYIIAIPKEEN